MGACGTVLVRASRHAKAARAFEAAAEPGPGSAAAHAGRAVACTVLGRHAEAAESFGRAARLDPSNPDPHMGRGNAMMESAEPPMSSSRTARRPGSLPAAPLPASAGAARCSG